MKNLLIKETRLFAMPLTYIFIAFSFMTMLPGYPILLGAFFVCLGIFQSVQFGRENNDILYSVLLPVKKGDVVKARFAFTCLIEGISFLIMCILTFIRMTFLSQAAPYINNALMNATPVFLAFVLLIYSAFQFFFLRGFFKTAYKIGKPFITFSIAAFLIVCVGEALHFFPGLKYLNNPAGEKTGMQLIVLAVSALVYAAVTYFSYRKSVRTFEKKDL